MQEIVIENQDADYLLNQLNQILEGEISDLWGQKVLTFKNAVGKGTIKYIQFDWGVTLIDYDLTFVEDVKLTYRPENRSPIDFIFVSEGQLGYVHNGSNTRHTLQRYQNVILSPLGNAQHAFFFDAGVSIKVNFIQIDQKKYARKKHSNLQYLNEVLFSVFEDKSERLPFEHLGNFNLKIADQVREMRGNKDEGIIRTLGLEGRMNIILALQLLEHHKFLNEETMPESLSAGDIKKIYQLSEYIVDNISNPLTIKIMSEQSGLSPKKLQLGFKMLYSTTINEYVKKVKLEISRDYLRSTELSISEIVYLVGIRSRSYFSKIFSEHYGLLPSEYRKKIKSKI
ncbi:AraC-type DNA-binding protein [Robiginitalea myxolifaciens]|uniref:AraC-type DNA-binding protein n=1 Tax=Robiginitalea myxolifaciens TaxID=400055 RepID=A0A1I6FNH2_9FLAO|nr:AraC family transcriptional regulator [Robiginitalea myxolifaciens]SFR31347.1 AraC-type DNA-binding protein [Robiginitalea myxolifaciens]